MENFPHDPLSSAQDEIVPCDPFRCRMWRFHDRLEDYLTDESCKEEILSMEKHGQIVPALGRRPSSDPHFDVELIYGARRLFVARHLNQPLSVRLRDMSDHDALIAMEIENRQRKDISPYERGLSYTRLLRAGLFKSQDDIARALHISAPTVSRLLRIARLPSVLLSAFRSPLDIAEDWGLQLIQAWEDPARRETLTRRARSIANLNPRPAARIVHARLMDDLSPARPKRPPDRDEMVHGSNGRPLFRIRRQRKLVALYLPLDALTAVTLNEVKQEVAALLERSRNLPDSPPRQQPRKPRPDNGQHVRAAEDPESDFS